MKTTLKKNKIFILSLLSFLLMSCGSSSYQASGQKEDSNYRAPNFDNGLLPPDNNEPPFGEEDPPPSSSPDTPISILDPLIEKEIQAIGYTSTSFTVHARDVLRIQFEPLPQSRTAGGTGFFPEYSRLAVYIEVNRVQRPTALLRNGVLGSAQKSSIFDFSNLIPKTCAESDPDCRETVRITITRPNYDYWCYNFGGQYCIQTPHTHVYKTHSWRGMVYVQTDDTDPIE